MAHFKNNRGFTLVELLAVVVIIGLMITISIPSLHRITQSSALGNGTRQFTDQVAMARTYAMVNLKDVYLVVPYSQTSFPNNTLSNTYCYSSYGFCVSALNAVQQSVSSLAGMLTNVTYIDAIQYLPQGAVFANQISNVSTQLVPFPTSTNTAVNIWCVKINKYGQIQSMNPSIPSTAWPTFSMMQGFLVGSNSVGTYAGTNTIAINPLTSKARITKS